jgi:hypothetical protein
MACSANNGRKRCIDVGTTPGMADAHSIEPAPLFEQCIGAIVAAVIVSSRDNVDAYHGKHAQHAFLSQK